MAAFLAIGTALVEEVEILDQQGEKWNDHFFTVAGGALGPPHGGFEGGPVTVEIAGWVHLVFENFEFLHVDFGPGPPQPTDGTHVETRDDGHERVEIPQIEAFLGHVDKVVEKADPVALFQLHAYFRRNQIGQPIEPLHVGLKISRPFHVPQCRLRKKSENFSVMLHEKRNEIHTEMNTHIEQTTQHKQAYDNANVEIDVAFTTLKNNESPNILNFNTMNSGVLDYPLRFIIYGRAIFELVFC